MFKDYYQFAHPTRVVAGRGMIEGVGFEFTKEGAKRPLIVTDQGIRRTGLIEKVEAGVTGGGLEVAGVFDEVPQDSSTRRSRPAPRPRRSLGADSFLAVGGGSVMDTAKVSATAASATAARCSTTRASTRCPARTTGSARRCRLPRLACIPTTAGTGSEVSFGAVIKDPEQHFKLLLGDFPLFPRLAILDPEVDGDPAAARWPRPPGWTR